MSKPTIMDVARLADVSKTTVSYVITGNGYVSEERRARIELAIARLGYRPNAFARGLSSSRVSTIGVVSADAADPFVARVTSGILTEAAARDIVVTVSVYGALSRATDVRRTAARQAGEALIYVAGSDFSRDVYATLAEQHLVVLAGEADPGVGVAAVMVDPRPAARELAALVASCGHQRVAVLAPARRRWSLYERVAGLREGLAGAGIASDNITTVAVEVSALGGRMAVDQLFLNTSDHPDRPTAVLCVDDSVALGVLQRSRQIGLVVPEHLSVTGFGDSPASQATTPSLTTARVPAETVGRAALEMLLRRTEMSADAISARMIAASVVAGETVHPPQRIPNPQMEIAQ
ncbi:LacI family DNA-binding transcriptional regulator [Microbacterium sp. KSW4-11]|uniref:LacI family DNA-binding transcriptional regulator n=1 Tax=Microbacterium gawkjiense TaxID=3067309 RepID=A0ABU3GE67_9MICO|nr:LacI family DNA-binding transcriptional regulator [Microbacterium sp. KSW4-11]MDT3318102.1 LacI family DNA-binding transcriptional regulator [Microbacterium sp. KSW4-11]